MFLELEIRAELGSGGKPSDNGNFKRFPFFQSVQSVESVPKHSLYIRHVAPEAVPTPVGWAAPTAGRQGRLPYESEGTRLFSR